MQDLNIALITVMLVFASINLAETKDHVKQLKAQVTELRSAITQQE